jgi:hypothetical protein
VVLSIVLATNWGVPTALLLPKAWLYMTWSMRESSVWTALVEYPWPQESSPNKTASIVVSAGEPIGAMDEHGTFATGMTGGAGCAGTQEYVVLSNARPMDEQ